LTYLSSPTTTESRVLVTRTTIPVGDEGPPHILQNEDKNFYTLSGELNLLIEEEVYQLSEGDFFRYTGIRFTHGKMNLRLQYLCL